MRAVDVAAVLICCVLFVGARPTSAAPPPNTQEPEASTTKTPAADAPVVRYRVRAGSMIDLGWTGIAHRQSWPTEQRIEFTLTCAQDGSCAAHGGAAGAVFGAPIPLSAGGIPACVINRLREPLSGKVGAKNGCGDLHLALSSSVYTAGNVARPCPICVDDKTPNDGHKQGRCDAGASAGEECDVNATSALFGKTSNDCLPVANAAVGTLAIDLAPLTTGTVRLAAERDCKRRRAGMTDHCFCAGQAQPNECESGTCGAAESCENTVDGVCSRASYRACRPGSGEADCNGIVAGSGTCENRIRPCFGDAIEASGVCNAATPTYVAIFCTPATQSSAINTSTGLAGPARLRLRLERVPDARGTRRSAPNARRSERSSRTNR